MKLFLLTQNDVTGYETYDSAVVAAESAEEAKRIHPRAECYVWTDKGWAYKRYDGSYVYNDQSWPDSLNDIHAQEIGIAGDVMPGVVLASFNAG